MDNVTHTLVGLMLSRAGGFNSNKARGEKGASVAIMLAANAPDMDTYNFFNDSLTYLQVHRGYTHSFAFAPLGHGDHIYRMPGRGAQPSPAGLD
jgi:inner membrane protein